MLRIEDTDQERFVDGALEIIYHTLEETGLIHDEGPDKDGGVGPYVQSERNASGLYLQYAKQLIDQLSGPFDIGDYHDEYQERLRNLIERKIHGQEIVKVKEKQSVQAVDLMEALSQSLKQTTAGAAKARTARKRTGKSLS